jgi:hypothetical protein
MSDWREKIKGAEPMTPEERAQSIVTYAAWAIVPDGRATMVKVIAQAIHAAELEAMRLGEITGASEPEGEWEYQMQQAISRGFESTRLFNARLSEGWEPYLFSDGMVIMRRKRS